MQIALIGYRATGKSTVGKLLAEMLNYAFVDMDERLVAGFGESIESFVGRSGWPAFREAESELLVSLCKCDRQVVATGGGLVLADRNRALLRRHFRVVWLDAGADTVLSRVAGDARTGDFRPALTSLAPSAEVVQLLAQREPLYGETAHHRIDTENAVPEQLARKIYDWISKQQNSLQRP